MTTTTPMQIPADLYDKARSDAATENRTASAQIEHWAQIGQATLDYPDLPACFIAKALTSLAEPRNDVTPFVPHTPNQDM